MEQFFDWFYRLIDFPALVLLMVFCAGVFVMYQTQKSSKNNFDFADMLRDDGGKPSALRLGIFVSLATSTWAVMYILINNNGQIDDTKFLGYCVIWSCSKIAEKVIELYSKR